LFKDYTLQGLIIWMLLSVLSIQIRF